MGSDLLEWILHTVFSDCIFNITGTDQITSGGNNSISAFVVRESSFSVFPVQSVRLIKRQKVKKYFKCLSIKAFFFPNLGTTIFSNIIKVNLFQLIDKIYRAFKMVRVYGPVREK